MKILWVKKYVCRILVFADSVGGLVFGIPLAQCLENDRLARVASGEVADVGSLTRNSRHGSRTSCTSLIEHSTNVSSKNDEVNFQIFVFRTFFFKSCESCFFD